MSPDLPSSTNLFSLAEENSGELEVKWDDILAHLSDGAKAKAQRFFNDVLKHGRITINLRQENLACFLNDGVYLNVHQMARRKAIENRTSLQSELAVRLGDWLDRRLAFESLFETGDNFDYGALNIGGLGAARFGDHCLVLKPIADAAPGPNTVYVKHDTLATPAYWGTDNSFQMEKFRGDPAGSNHRGHLAGIKHGAQAAALEDQKCPGLLCNTDDYIEAIFLNSELAIRDLETVRMSKKQHEEYFGYLLDFELGGLPDDKMYILQTFRETLTILRENNVPLEVVNA